MKKKLTSNSFDALKMEQQPSGEIANRAMSGGGYFNEYGILYQAADGNTYWTRTREDSGNSHGATFGDYWDSLNSDYQAAGSDMYDPNVLNYGTSNNPVSQADYNTLARKGRWFGGYVEGLGRVEEYASSIDYGNSIYNGSWVRYGSEGYPVSKTDYYQLSEDGDWHGGYVEGHGYLGEHDYIPGMSTSQVYTGVNRVKTNGVNIVVNRMSYGDKSTLSQFKMFAYGAYGEILSTLEGYFLEPEADYERSNKAGSDTAILPGVYEVQPSTYDGREGYYEVKDVIGRTAIKIHEGNTGGNTEGCLLPGTSWSEDITKKEYQVHDSGTKLGQMREFLERYAKDDNITIDITL